MIYRGHRDLEGKIKIGNIRVSLLYVSVPLWFEYCCNENT
jgi:hypothetical protein